MNNYRDIIKAPIITEKTADAAQNNRTYVFSVDTKANKTQIKQAIEAIFNVKVENVNTVNVKPKKKELDVMLEKQIKLKKHMLNYKKEVQLNFNNC